MITTTLVENADIIASKYDIIKDIMSSKSRISCKRDDIKLITRIAIPKRDVKLLHYIFNPKDKVADKYWNSLESAKLAISVKRFDDV